MLEQEGISCHCFVFILSLVVFSDDGTVENEFLIKLPIVY